MTREFKATFYVFKTTLLFVSARKGVLSLEKNVY